MSNSTKKRCTVQPGETIQFNTTTWGYWNARTSSTSSVVDRLSQLGPHNVDNSTSRQQLQTWTIELQKFHFVMMMETPKLQCGSCQTPSWNFIEDAQTSTSICLGPNGAGCGRSYRMSYKKQGQLYLNDDGKANKGQWECTPGMSHHDTGLFTKGQRVFPSHEKFHHANLRKMLIMIDDIVDDFPTVMGAGTICKNAKNILRLLYRSIHYDEYAGDNKERMWHSPPNITATCILCAVLAFEKRMGSTIFTVPRIAEAAQAHVPHKRKRGRYERRPRDVKVQTLLKYARRLKEMGLVRIELPKEIPLEWTLRASANVKNEHLRIAEFRKCVPVTVHLPHDQSWGMAFEEIPNFIQVDSTTASLPAFQVGLVAGDYIIQINEDTISVETKLNNVIAMIGKAKQSGKNVTMTIMRKK